MLFTRHNQFSPIPQNGVITKWNNKFPDHHIRFPALPPATLELQTMAVYNTLEPVKNLLKQELAPVFLIDHLLAA